jgi:short-subunit dehydrogenase
MRARERANSRASISEGSRRGWGPGASGKVVAITGASAGIGRATALRLARDGAAVAICARRKDRLDEVAAEIQQAGGEVLAVAGDVTREADMDALVAHTTERFGRLDVMMCNAGFGVYGAIDQMHPSQMRRLMDVNYMGTYLAARAALPLFRRQGHGHLLIVSSIVGRRGIPYMGAYAATKFAQIGLAESLRAELQGTGIAVTVVYPISTRTEFFDVMTSESGFATEAQGPSQHVSAVADAIARAIEQPVAEVFPYRKARLLAVVNAIAPAFTDRLVRRWGRRPI